MNTEEFYRQIQSIRRCKHEYLQEKNRLQTLINQAIEKEQQITQEYISVHGFTNGTKVTYADTHYIVHSGDTVNVNEPQIYYTLTKPKKDGTSPKHCIDRVDYIRHSDLVEGWE